MLLLLLAWPMVSPLLLYLSWATDNWLNVRWWEKEHSASKGAWEAWEAPAWSWNLTSVCWFHSGVSLPHLWRLPYTDGVDRSRVTFILPRTHQWVLVIFWPFELACEQGLQRNEPQPEFDVEQSQWPSLAEAVHPPNNRCDRQKLGYRKTTQWDECKVLNPF